MAKKKVTKRSSIKHMMPDGMPMMGGRMPEGMPTKPMLKKMPMKKKGK